jgi:hypothetical protein
MARFFLSLDYREYRDSPLGRARFFGVLPLEVGEAEGLRRERYLWGEVLVLDRRGRKRFFSFSHYTPSSQAARTGLLRYAFYRVMEGRGFELRGRIGEVLVFRKGEETVFLAAKWGGYTPQGARRVLESVSSYLYQVGGRFWFFPAPGRRFGRFLKAHPVAAVIPEEVAREGLSLYEAYARGTAPTRAVRVKE